MSWRCCVTGGTRVVWLARANPEGERMRHAGKWRRRWMLGSLFEVQMAIAASSPADKQAFLNRPKMYLAFEITETGSREFGVGTPNDAFTDGAYRINRRVTF